MNYNLITPVNPSLNLTAIQRILTNRGLKLEDIPHYLHTTDEDIINPTFIDNIREGAAMLVRHISTEDNVLIQVDSDTDGMTSAALLINYLNCLFPAFAQSKIIYRMHEGKQHGLVDEIIPLIDDNDIKLVIAPDSSSNDYDMHQYLKERGIDVLVIDHHEAEKVSEYACVINNQLCDYPTKSLSGVAMVWKFCCYIDQLMNTDHAQKFLDLVALGLIADMMDVKDFETKRLIEKGLKSLRNPFFKTAAAKQSYMIDRHGGLNSHTIGFYIAPFVNATMRVGTQKEKYTLFESMLDFKGYELIPSNKTRGPKGLEPRAEQAVRNGSNIKTHQDKEVEVCLGIIKKIIEEKNLLENKVLVLKLKPEFAIDKNITGLVANKLANEYQRPTLILNQVYHTDDKTITWEGSARGYDKSNFKNFKDFCEDTQLILYAQGHQNAFGFGISDEKIDDFIIQTNLLLADYDFTPCYSVDIIWDNYDFNSKEILDIAELDNIWGQGLTKPLIAIENIKLNSGNIKLLKETTLRITLNNGVVLIKFGSNEEEYEKLYSELGCITINIVGECKANEWNGMVTPQIELKDYEIVSEQKYYF